MGTEDHIPEYSINEEEMREAIEKGRRYKIAAEVWREFLDDRREEIIKSFENGFCNDEMLAELRIMNKFRDLCKAMIAVGEIAEEDLQKYGE